MPNHLLDHPTLDPGADSTALDEAGLIRRAALTIVWHPDLERIGQSAVLPDSESQISRALPLFGDRTETASGAPLADVYLSSREPSVTIRQVRDRIEVIPGPASAHVKIGGARLSEPLMLSRTDVDRGVIITLARRVVLCLHLARPVRIKTRSSHGLVGVSDGLDDVRRDIDRVADLDVALLIRGETGTGKGLVAASVVSASPRAGRPFLSLNMGAIVPSTAGSELFGHERGSFTGATASKAGLFVAADSGTLFLDEVGLMPPDVQPMLLHVLETKEVRPLGAARGRKIDVRFIAATDTNIEQAIRRGTFSEALLQRLARYQIFLPPLRHRREDFGVLLLHLLRVALQRTGEPDRLAGDGERWLAPSTVAALASYDWPGNIRELENVAGQIVVASRGEPTAVLPNAVKAIVSTPRTGLAEPTPAPSTTAMAGRSGISDAEVARALARSNGSASAAAKILGVSRTTYYELRKRNPHLRSITEIPDEELRRCRDECGGDVTRMAARLQVPIKALKDRLAHLSRRDP
jgi:two-component system, NtrC family, nitrogen regulation response regulator GlnG